MQAIASSDDRSLEVMEAVQGYWNLGLTVIPVCKPVGSGCNVHARCTAPGKVPVMQNWQKVYRSPVADARITELFQQHDWDLNIGLLCGKEHGLYVVDIDGHEGNFSLACENDMGVLDQTVIVTTGRVGGYHYWYRPIESDPPMPKKIGFIKKVDFIGEGGFVLAPPSIHASGRKYTFTDDSLDLLDTAEEMSDPLATLAEWTRDLVNVKGRHSNVLHLPLSDEDDAQVKIGQRALTFLSQGAVDAQREEACHTVANLLGRGMEREEIIERVSHALIDLSPQTKPEDPWTMEHVEKLVDHMSKKRLPAKALAEEPKLIIPGVSSPTDTLIDSRIIPEVKGDRTRDIFDALNEEDLAHSYVEGIVFKNQCHVAFAAAGTGKTLWTLELMLHLAAGRDWHTKQVSEPKKVLLIEIDDTYQLAGYMESMRDAFGFTKEELGGRFITNNKDDTDFDLETANNRLALQAFIQHHSPDVVVLDHLEGFLPKIDSYGSVKYHQFREFKTWCKDHGITLWVIDHSKKGWTPNTEEGQPNNHLEALAGGQQKLAVFDVAYHMYGSLEDGPVTIWYAKLRDRKPDPLSWSFGSDGSRVFAKVEDPYSKLSVKERAVVEFICNKGPVTTSQVLEGCGLSRASLHRLLQAILLPRNLVSRLESGRDKGRGGETVYGIGSHYQREAKLNLNG